MRVGFNTALGAGADDYRQTGVSRYVTELERALRATATPGDALVSLGERLPEAGRRPLARIGWEQTLLAADIARRRLDVYHGPVNSLPVLRRVPGVVTVHDLAFLRYPETVPAVRRAWLVATLRHSARAAARVIAVSQHTADDLQSWLAIDAGKVRVVPLAASGSIRRLEGTELRVFRLARDIDWPYVLAVGTLEPRKNLPILLRAFAAIRDRVPHRLVLVGPEGWLTEELHRTIAELGLDDRLVMTGFVDDATLGGWYSGADLVAFPSLYEGFGLPLLEAMACGAPVLASDASSLPEVGGAAARYADPHDVAGWSHALVALLEDAGARAAMRAAGLDRTRAMSWERTARATWDVYREAAR